MSEQHYLESLRITGKIQRETNSPELMLIPTQQRLQCVCPVKMISKSPFPHSPMYSCYKKKSPLSQVPTHVTYLTSTNFLSK